MLREHNYMPSIATEFFSLNSSSGEPLLRAHEHHHSPSQKIPCDQDKLNQLLNTKIVRCPAESLSLSNCAIVNENDYDLNEVRHVEVTTATKQKYVFTLRSFPDMISGQMGFSVPMRKWAELSINQTLEVRPYTFNPHNQYISKISLEVDFHDRKTTLDPYDTDEMSLEFLSSFANQAFTTGQMLAFKFKDLKLLKLVVMEMEVANIENITGNGNSSEKRTTRVGLFLPNTVVIFERAKDSGVILTGKCKGQTSRQSLINPNFHTFLKMGIGGLDHEVNTIFRRAFASRVFPPEFVQQLGLKHVRGILLYGPPGTGKTLLARVIGRMLNAREPKIVNGPQILDKYVGESEANIRRLFAEAEEEEKRLGPNSGLHIIIFDEIDAICKTRGSVAGNTGVHDTVVNQLLAKIDGVESLNNILVIGMTNRKDLIDEALLRPGRLEIQLEIGLPDESGRLQILIIHTSGLRHHNVLEKDVDLGELAALTKNFSGAEIEGLIRAAEFTAMNRLIKASNKVEIDAEATEKIRVSRSDFLHALENDIKPAFGTSADEIERLGSQGIINWGTPVATVLEDGELFIQQARSEHTRGIVSILLEGPPNSGKTALAAKLALKSKFPFIKLCSPEDMVGYTETAKCQMIKKIFDDAYKSRYSCILVDSIERLLDYGAIGRRYSNLVLQALLVLLKKEPPKGRRLLVLCTSSRPTVLEEMEMISAFTSVLHVSNLHTSDQLIAVLEESDCFQEEQLPFIKKKTEGRRLFVGIKKLLAYIDLAKQNNDEHRVEYFLAKLEDEECLEPI